MPDPISTLSLVTTLWKESKPLRAWIWGKLPGVKDAKNREEIEQKLAHLLDDANKLVQGIPAAELDAKLDARIELFRKDVLASGMKEADANGLVERASVLVRLMVTGPFQDVLQLRRRMSETEAALELVEKTMAELASRERIAETRVMQLEQRSFRQSLVVSLALAVSCVSLVMLIVVLVTRR